MIDERAQNDLDITLSAEELKVLAGIDSTSYGVLKLNVTENAETKALILKAVKCLESVLVALHQIKKPDSLAYQKGQGKALTDEISSLWSSVNDNNGVTAVDAYMELCIKIYCKLGHFNLLLEQYDKALSAYQKYYNLKEDYWKNSAVMYGLGLTYFHFNAFKWAIKTFRHLLYLHTGFIRSNEVHFRLGLMFKVLQDFECSRKHFNLVLADSNLCSFTRSEVSFHIAHLFEVQGKYADAKVAYEQLLEQNDLSVTIRAEISKQLALLYLTVDHLGDKSQRQTLSLNLLQKSIEADPKNGQSLYFLGRCFAGLGKVHDAFISYRSSVDKSDANADTWCSIGVLYQQQKQPMDALQAYICAVQLDKSHTPAWTNLGILYENYNQIPDALKCYINAINGKGPADHNILARIDILKDEVFSIKSNSTQRTKQLPFIEEAWNFPVSQEMAARQNAAAVRQVEQQGQIMKSGSSYNLHQPPAKKMKQCDEYMQTVQNSSSVTR